MLNLALATLTTGKLPAHQNEPQAKAAELRGGREALRYRIAKEKQQPISEKQGAAAYA